MFELTEEQQAVCTSMRRFAQRELRWRARKLDAAPPGTVDWELLRKSCDFGLLSAHLPPHYGGTMDRLSAAIASLCNCFSASWLARMCLSKASRSFSGTLIEPKTATTCLRTSSSGTNSFLDGSAGSRQIR